MAVTFLRPSRRAYSKANFETRVEAFSVIILRLSTTRTTAAETSGPMPSPGMSVIVCFILKAESRSQIEKQNSGVRIQDPEWKGGKPHSVSLFFWILDSGF